MDNDYKLTGVETGRFSGKPFPRRSIYLPSEFPTIVCLCGSTRFWRHFQELGLRFTLEGKIVLSIGAARAPDDDDKSFGGFIAVGRFDSKKKELDELHKRKIDLADEVYVINVGGYIGDSTRSEVEYAVRHQKPITYFE